MDRTSFMWLAIVIFFCAVRPVEAKEADMKVTSSAFKDNEMMPDRFGYRHENVNPPLSVEGAPQGTKSMALIVDDPDAPRGTWVHWVVYDMPPLRKIDEGSVPGTQGINDFKTLKYDGPCPPSGTHRYIFTLYALDSELALPGGADKKTVERAMEGHVLVKAALTGLYKSKR
jgi:Raf kinase inhibitor-like YbhB/YbcL family protein